MSKLDVAAAEALGRLMVDGRWVYRGAGKCVPVEGWVDRYEIGLMLREQYLSAYTYTYDNEARAWIVGFDLGPQCPRPAAEATHADMNTAALMAFCKHKGVAYE